MAEGSFPQRALVLLSSLQTGGAERVTVSFLQRLAERGKAATVCTLTARDDGFLASELAAGGVRRLDLGALRLADPRALWRLVRLLRRERITLVHAHGQDACILAAAARVLTHVPLILSRHVLDEPADNWRQRLRARAALAAYARADAPLAVSDAAADRLAQIANVAREKIVVIRNGVDLARFERQEGGGGGADLRCCLGFRDEDMLVLLPAVLRRGKGHELLLQALPDILARAPSAKLVFAGAGEREAELRTLAARWPQSVIFLGQRDDVPELMSACDLVVLPSEAEALPTVLMEAAASARAVVATRVGGTPEVVEHGRTGLVVPPNDPAALGSAVLTLLLDPGKRRAFGEQARALAAQRFTLERQVDETLLLWQSVASGLQQ